MLDLRDERLSFVARGEKLDDGLAFSVYDSIKTTWMPRLLLLSTATDVVKQLLNCLPQVIW